MTDHSMTRNVFARQSRHMYASLLFCWYRVPTYFYATFTMYIFQIFLWKMSFGVLIEQTQSNNNLTKGLISIKSELSAMELHQSDKEDTNNTG